jgi:hypothetical protein
MISPTWTGDSARVASPTDSSTRCTAGSPVTAAFGQVQIRRSTASWRAAAANRSWVVFSSRCIMGTCGGSGTTRTPGRSRTAAAISRAWPRYSGISGSRRRRQFSAEAAFGHSPNSVPPIRCRHSRTSASRSADPATQQPASAPMPL